MKKILLFFSFLMLINLYALDCKNAYSTADTNECENLKYIQADKKLNETYKKLISKLDPEAKELLKKAQKAWIVYRDSNADFNAVPPPCDFVFFTNFIGDSSIDTSLGFVAHKYPNTFFLSNPHNIEAINVFPIVNGEL